MKMYYVTILSNLKFCYNKYSNTISKFEKSSFQNKFFLLYRNQLSIGLHKNKKLLEKLNNPLDRILIIETKTSEELFSDHNSGLGQYIKNNKININKMFLDNLKSPILTEEAIALSFKTDNLKFNFKDLAPRSFSFLPISKGCQAKCSFCFSAASISQDFKGKNHELKNLDFFAKKSLEAGAERAVITGGGEPTLLEHETLLKSLRILKNISIK